MRIRTRWFKKSHKRKPGELAGVVAMLIWRIARQSLARMRAADFEIETGTPYFNFLAEWLVFLIQAADRYAFAHFSAAERYEFTSTLSKHLAGTLIDNLDELLGVGDETPEVWKKRFIDMVNRRGGDYAEYEFDKEHVDYGFLRQLAHALAKDARAADRLWVHDQVMEIEAPRALDDLRRGVVGLFNMPKPAAPEAECNETAVDPHTDDTRHHRGLQKDGKVESMLHD